MTEAPGRTRMRRGSAPAALLHAAREVFAERGYRGTTTKDVADRAGTSESLIFRYYGSKADLLATAVIRPVVTYLEDFTREWQTDESRRNTGDIELIREFIGIVYDLVNENRGLYLALLAVLIDPPEELDLRALRDALTSIFDTTTGAFASFIDDGAHRAGDPGMMLRMGLLLVGSTGLALPATYSEPRAVPDRDLAVDELTYAVVYGMQKPAL